MDDIFMDVPDEITITDIEVPQEDNVDNATYCAVVDSVTNVEVVDANGFVADLLICITKTSNEGFPPETRHLVRRMTFNAKSLFDKAEGHTDIVIESKQPKGHTFNLMEMRRHAGLI